MTLLPCRRLSDIPRRGGVVPAEAREVAAAIVEDVRQRGEPALREHAARFGELGPRDPLVVERPTLDAALARLDAGERARLERLAARIRLFADAQRRAITDVTVAVPGGRAGHRVTPVERAGCYAPGGRYPLFSSVLMTAITARTAGVPEVWVASPRPGPLVLAAAAVADADALLAVGGAQAIAALAYGAGPVPACDVIVGPGNHYVTAAKQLIAGVAGTDVPAGPSELLVFADAGADPAQVAADLLAQAEHDPAALPLLVALDAALPGAVERELERQLADLPTAGVARAALAHGGVIVVSTLEEGIETCNAIAPEHLQLHLDDDAAAAVGPRLTQYGALFIGAAAGEVLGDYGAGPNHVLPTGGAARWTGGLSVLSFLRLQTWLEIRDPAAADALADDAAWCGRAEGLEAHARASERRRGG